MRAYYMVVIFLASATIIAALLLQHAPTRPRAEVELDELWNIFLEMTGAENDSAILNNARIHLAGGIVDRASIRFCDVEKCYEANLSGWVKSSDESKGHAHPTLILKHLDELLRTLNLTNADVYVEVLSGESSACLMLRDNQTVRIERMRSDEYYLLRVNHTKFVFWNDVVEADYVEPVFFVKVTNSHGDPIANAKVVMKSRANPLCNPTTITNESGIGTIRDRCILKIFEYPFDIIVKTGDVRKRAVVFGIWNAELNFTRKTEGIFKNFKLELKSESIVERGLVKFKPKLIYMGNRSVPIYFGHVHPFTIEVRNESGVVCRLPELILSMISKTVVKPGSKLAANLSCYIGKSGVYEVYAVAEISPYEDLNEVAILRSNPVFLVVV